MALILVPALIQSEILEEFQRSSTFSQLTTWQDQVQFCCRRFVKCRFLKRQILVTCPVWIEDYECEDEFASRKNCKIPQLFIVALIGDRMLN